MIGLIIFMAIVIVIVAISYATVKYSQWREDVITYPIKHTSKRCYIERGLENVYTSSSRVLFPMDEDAFDTVWYAVAVSDITTKRSYDFRSPRIEGRVSLYYKGHTLSSGDAVEATYLRGMSKYKLSTLEEKKECALRLQKAINEGKKHIDKVLADERARLSVEYEEAVIDEEKSVRRIKEERELLKAHCRNAK